MVAESSGKNGGHRHDAGVAAQVGVMASLANVNTLEVRIGVGRGFSPVVGGQPAAFSPASLDTLPRRSWLVPPAALLPQEAGASTEGRQGTPCSQSCRGRRAFTTSLTLTCGVAVKSPHSPYVPPPPVWLPALAPLGSSHSAPPPHFRCKIHKGSCWPH